MGVFRHRSPYMWPPHLNKDLGGGVKVYVFNVVQRPHKATQEEMSKFHSDDYVKFLRCIRPDNMSEYNKLMQRCKYLHGRTWPSPFESYIMPLMDWLELFGYVWLVTVIIYKDIINDIMTLEILWKHQ